MEDLIKDEFVKVSGRDRRGATVNMLDDSDDDSTSDFEPIDGFIGEDGGQMGGDNNNAICLDDNEDSNASFWYTSMISETHTLHPLRLGH